ncbi:MAG: tetraacyldisaccharide 4'-kinase [Flavobacteriales bacterium]
MKARDILYFPISLVYGTVVFTRNKWYDWGWLSAKAFDTPTLAIGNLRTGGSGKTPHTEYVVSLLKDRYKLAVLSRGYGRKTKGFRLAAEVDNAETIGDEPFQIYQKFPEITVAVDACRARGMQTLERAIKPEVVVLDDAFQHRGLQPGLTLLLTPFSQPYTSDFLLPMGDLREWRTGAKRAHCIVITKSPKDLTPEEQRDYLKQIKPEKNQSVYFSTIAYADTVLGKQRRTLISLPRSILVVTGIANPKPLLQHLDEKGFHYEHLAFTDHHNFTRREIEKMKLYASETPILTTEKDYMRLRGKIENLYYLPIAIQILDAAEQFDQMLVDYVRGRQKHR